MDKPACLIFAKRNLTIYKQRAVQFDVRKLLKQRYGFHIGQLFLISDEL